MKYFIIREQDDTAKAPIATFAARGFLTGWLVSDTRYIFGKGEQAFVLSKKALDLGYEDPRDLMRFFINHNNKFPDEI